MTDLHLRPRTVSELVDAAFALYRRHSLQYILAAALCNVPLLILELLTLRPIPQTAGDVMAAAAPILLRALASLFTYSIVSAIVVRLGADVYLGGEPDLGKSLRAVAPRIPALAVATVIKGTLGVLGALFFFVGWFYVLARYFAVGTVIMLEGKGPLEAFGRSSALSKGRKRHVLNTLLLVGLIYFILSIGVGAVAELTGSLVMQLVFSMLFSIVAYPVIALTELTLYYDARIRSEGFDLEQMAAALDTGRAVPAAGGAAT